MIGTDLSFSKFEMYGLASNENIIPLTGMTETKILRAEICDCRINDTCYALDQVNPENSCQVCRSDWGSSYLRTWGYRDFNFTPCDDNDTSTYNDRCSSGICIGRQPSSCESVEHLDCTTMITEEDGSCTEKL